MNHLHNPKLTSNAQKLRKAMTKEERRLWFEFLKPNGINAHRQKALGPYIVDFYIAGARLVIELDGSQHYEGSGPQHDTERDDYLQSQGLTILRYTNLDVNQHFTDVCEDILRYLTPHQSACG